MKNKPDDRSDNADKIQKHIDMTKLNMELANDMIANTSDPKTKKELEAKNQRRKVAIKGMQKEIKDEEGVNNT